MPSYNTLVKLHRFLVKFMIVFGLIMLATGTVLRYPNLFLFLDVDQMRLIHSTTAAIFGPIFFLMLVTGTLMYFHPKLSGLKIFSMATPGTWQIKLLSKKEVAKGTMKFRFEKPRGFNFVPGQHLEWLEIDPSETDAEGENRTFTISSAPFENHLAFTTRMRDTAYKRVLAKMSPGTKIQVSGLEGDFVLPPATSYELQAPVVMLAGGIGVTPFRSMLVQAVHDKTLPEVYLFSSNRTPADAPFLDELKELAQTNKKFRFFPIFTDTSGHITAKLLQKNLPANFKKSLYFVSGPPAMVTALKSMLKTALKIPASQILTDNFTGY